MSRLYQNTNSVTNTVDYVTSTADYVISTVDYVTSIVDSVTSTVDSVASFVDYVTSTVDSVTSTVDSVASTADSYTAHATQFNCFKCFYTNADSILNKLDEFQGRIESNDYSIIGGTEVKPKRLRVTINPAELALLGFDLFHNLTEDNGRGIALYIRESLKATQFLTFGTTYQESVWAEITLKGTDILLVGCVYRCPGSSAVYNDNLIILINEATAYKHSHFIMLGDYNYPNINWEYCNTPKADESPEYE